MRSSAGSRGAGLLDIVKIWYGSVGKETVLLGAAVNASEMDRLIELHLAAERAGDADASVAVYTDDVEHDVVGAPHGPMRGRDAARSFYEQLNREIATESMTPTRTYHGEDFCVTEHEWTGTVYTITRPSADPAGALREMAWQLPAGGWSPQPHVHPLLTEDYEVLDGELELLIDGAWRRLRTGDRATVAAGTVHTFRTGPAP